MRITQYTDYGLRTLIYLGAHPGDIIPMPLIAEHYGISANHLMKVTQQLAKLGYIESIRRRNGGLRLKRAPREINIGTVIREMEPLDIVECFSQCIIAPSCRLKGVLGRALHVFRQELAKHSLEDLIGNRDQLVALLHSSAPGIESSST